MDTGDDQHRAVSMVSTCRPSSSRPARSLDVERLRGAHARDRSPRHRTTGRHRRDDRRAERGRPLLRRDRRTPCKARRRGSRRCIMDVGTGGVTRATTSPGRTRSRRTVGLTASSLAARRTRPADWPPTIRSQYHWASGASVSVGWPDGPDDGRGHPNWRPDTVRSPPGHDPTRRAGARWWLAPLPARRRRGGGHRVRRQRGDGRSRSTWVSTGTIAAGPRSSAYPGSRCSARASRRPRSGPGSMPSSPACPRDRGAGGCGDLDGDHRLRRRRRALQGSTDGAEAAGDRSGSGRPRRAASRRSSRSAATIWVIVVRSARPAVAGGRRSSRSSLRRGRGPRRRDGSSPGRSTSPNMPNIRSLPSTRPR